MKVGKQTDLAFCPDCEEQVHLGPRPELGQRVTCSNCWAYLEIISLDPLKLSWDMGPEEEELLEEKWEEDEW